MAYFLGFSHMKSLEFIQKWWRKQLKSSMWQFCRQKCLTDHIGQKSWARLVHAERKATVTQITTLYSHDEQKLTKTEQLKIKKKCGLVFFFFVQTSAVQFSLM